MINVRRSSERGHADHGWLETYHTFSFGHYFDPDHVGFSELLVLNQDRVVAGQGFPTHGHRDMEIVSYVLDGALEHRDSMGNGSTMRPGDVQLMSAGTGVMHSEFNASDREPLHFLQMWVQPAVSGTEPRYEQKYFAPDQRRGVLRPVVAPDGVDGAVAIAQDARMFASLLGPGERVEHGLADDRVAWLHVARGAVELRGAGDGIRLDGGDGAAITGERTIALAGLDDAELVLWELPAR